jgi:hypothetical protein
MPLDPRRVLTFREVARQRSFSRAAAALALTQPAVSQQVAALERSLGVALLVRGPGGPTPTEAGEVLLGHAEAIAERLALRYWEEFAHLVAGIAELDERDPLDDPVGAVLEALAAGFRARPGFLALWYGGLRTEQLRDATRPTRTAMGRSIERMLAVHWPQAKPARRATVARLLVLMGDGLLREAFRLDPAGDGTVLAEAAHALRAYARARLGIEETSG